MFALSLFRRRSFLLVVLSGLVAIGSLNAQQIPRSGAPPVAPEHPGKVPSVLAAATSDGGTGTFVDISTRERSRTFYQAVYPTSENVSSGWTGNLVLGIAGTTSQAFRDAMARRINYYRAMAGIPAAITLLDTYCDEDQEAALMMSVNGQLNHTPPATWIDYTAAGADAASHSNLYLGINGPAAINGYIEDPGDNNAAVGHRRWILYPQTLTMGTGDVDGPAIFSLLNGPANALWVIDSNYGTTRPATRDGFVAWPPPGFVPYTQVSPRWSFSWPGADFSQASVSMTNGGKPLTLTQESSHNGYGENTLVWTPQGVTLSPDNPLSSVPVEQQEPTFHVTVSGVLIDGSPTTFVYDVTAFDPAQAGTGQHPAFFNDETPMGNGVYYLTLANGNVVGFYSYLGTPDFLYHFDLGYEYFIDAGDDEGGLFLYDFQSNDWFYTSRLFSFPFLYDFSLRTVLYYYPDPNNPDHYNTNGTRYFYRYDTGQIFSK